MENTIPKYYKRINTEIIFLHENSIKALFLQQSRKMKTKRIRYKKCTSFEPAFFRLPLMFWRNFWTGEFNHSHKKEDILLAFKSDEFISFFNLKKNDLKSE